MSYFRCRSAYIARFAPTMAPSREMSVQMTVPAPMAWNRSQKASSVQSLVSSQPLMAILPSRTSAPRAMAGP